MRFLQTAAIRRAGLNGLGFGVRHRASIEDFFTCSVFRFGAGVTKIFRLRRFSERARLDHARVVLFAILESLSV